MARFFNDYDEANHQNKLWNPKQILPSVWLDGKDISTISQASNVDAWRDKSGYNRTFVQSNQVQRPIYSNGYLTFDGSNDILSCASSGSSGISNFNVFFIGGVTAVDESNDSILSIGVSGNISIRSVFRYVYTTTMYLACIGNDASSGVSWDIGTVNNMFEVRQNGQPVTFTKNTVETIANLSSVPSVTLSNVFSIGGYSGSGSQYTKLSILSMIAFYRTTYAIEHKSIQGYLARKNDLQFRLPAGHIYKNTPPLM